MLESQIQAEVCAAPELPSAGDQLAQMNAFMMAKKCSSSDVLTSGDGRPQGNSGEGPESYSSGDD